MDIACFFGGKLQSIAERVWEGSGWNAQHALERLREKSLLEETEFHNLRMHDHLRDLGREMALEFGTPHRLWRPQHLKYLESKGFRYIVTKTNVRCFHSIFDKSMNSQVTFFLGQSDICIETSASLLWLELKGNSTEQPVKSIPSWIPLQSLQCLKIKRGQLKTLWKNRIQAPSQLKELHISETSLKKFPNFSGISDNLEKVFLDARELPIQGLSLLESLSMDLCSLHLRLSTLRGKQACTKRGEGTTCESLVIDNFKFIGEVAWNNGRMSSGVKAPMSGLEKLEISGEELVSKILISGIHYSSLQSIKLHDMENLEEVDLIRVNTLNCLDIANCKNLTILKSESGILNLPKLVLLNISKCPKLKELNLGHLSCLERITIVDCKDLKSVLIFSLRNLVELNVNASSDYLECMSRVSCSRIEAELNISKCPELEKLMFAHLSSLEKNVIEKCSHLRSVSRISDLAKIVLLNISQCAELEELSLGHLSSLEGITIVDCKHLKSVSGIANLAKLLLLDISQCAELEELSLGHLSSLERVTIADLSCVERIIIDGCEKLKYLQVYGCPNLRSISGNLGVKRLYISDCPELEELPSFSRLSCLERIVIDSCEKVENIADIEELQALKSLQLLYCSNAAVQNYIPKLKSVPSDYTVVIGRAVDGAESILNEYLFYDAEIGADAITEIGAENSNDLNKWQVSAGAVIVCSVVVVDSSTPVEDINKSLRHGPAYNRFEVRQGEWVIAMVAPHGCLSYYYYMKIKDFLSRFRVRKGFRIEVKKVDEWKRVRVLHTIVDRLYHL